jgi:HD superfamily phosphohydrolase
VAESNQKRAKVFRDPVHDIISWDREAALGPLIVALIDTPEFQRLRFVRQVGLASLVFHGAEHSRFAHSMGVATLARRMFDQLHPNADKEDTYRVATIVAGLLHDVGHAPFSHAMERVCGFRHEAYSELLVLDEASSIFRTLRDFDPTLPKRVAGYFDHSTQHHIQLLQAT